MKRKLIITLVVILPVLTGGQCNCHRYEFNWQTFRFERVGKRLPQIRPDKQTREKLVKQQEIIPPKGKQTEHLGRLSQKQKRSILAGRVFRLYLGNKGTSEGIPDENLVIIGNACVDKLAELLELVYPGEGPGGSMRLRFILYRDGNIWQQAKEFAKELDVPMWKKDMEEDDDWKVSIGMIYGTRFPRKINPEMRFKILSRLNRLIKNPNNSIKRRWAGTIIASEINSRFEPRDFIAAGANLLLGEKIARGNSYWLLVTDYHRIKLLQMKREKLKMRRLCQETLDKYRVLENTECYQMILAMLGRK